MLKGKTIIELTDVKTGKKEYYEDNNMVTGAIDDIILNRKKYYGFSQSRGTPQTNDFSSFIGMFPLYKRFFGGVLLFGNTIEEDRKYITGDDVVIGSATYENGYNGNDSKIGSFNTSESEINTEERYVKYVYDFATNQGNGDIKSICLGNYHYISCAAYGTEYFAEDIKNIKIHDILRATNTGGTQNNEDNYVPHYNLYPTDKTTNFEITDNCWENPILYDDLNDYLITLEYASSKGTPSSSSMIDIIRLHIYDIGFKNVWLFENIDNGYYGKIEPREILKKDFYLGEDLTMNCHYGYYNFRSNCDMQAFYDKSTGYAYVLWNLLDSINVEEGRTSNYWEAGEHMGLFKFNLNVEDYNNVEMETVSIYNGTGQQIQIALGMSSSLYNRNFWVKDDYIYVPLTAEGFAKIKITDSTDVTVFSTGAYKWFADCVGDLIYLTNDCFTGQDGVACFNTKTNTVSYTKTKTGVATSALKPIPFKNNNVYCFYTGAYVNGKSVYTHYCGIPASRNDYLATINNLETPVTKTNDKTMKITYILREG